MTKWQLAVGLVLVLVIALGVHKQLHATPVVNDKLGLSSTNLKVKVVSGGSQDFNPDITSSNSQPGSSTSIQASGSQNASTSGSATSSPIQNDANLNDPSVRNSPLVQSLYTGN